MTDWIRRDFDGIGVTQYRPGKHLKAIADRYSGRVILCIDISGSMGAHEAGMTRLRHAIGGAERFIADAIAAHYQVGLILWHHNVAAFVPVTDDPEAVLRTLRDSSPTGGNDIVPTLRVGIRELGPLTGDRVMAIFGDGDLGSPGPAIEVAREAAALGIRIVVRGLGEHAAAAMSVIATDAADAGTLVATTADVAAGISSMMATITALARPSGRP